MPRVRTVAIWVGALELIGIFFAFRGYRSRDHTRSVAIGDLFRPGAAVAPMKRSDTVAFSAPEDAPPEDPAGRVVWFSRRYSEQYASAERQMALDEFSASGFASARLDDVAHLTSAN